MPPLARAGRPVRFTDGPILPAVLSLAWPVFISRALHTAYGVADTVWVGRLGAAALAAVSTSFFASWMIYAGGTAFVSGVTALVSQAVGANRDEEAARAALTGLVLAAGTGVAVAVAGWFGAGPLFELLFDDAEVVSLGATYLSVFALGAPLVYVTLVLESLFRSCGDSRTPMLVLLVGTGLNVILDPLLILGVGPFPRLGVLGAALATIVSEAAVLAVWAILYARGRFPLPIRLSAAFPSFSPLRARQIYRIGIPEALIEVLFSAVYLFLASVTGVFGAAVTAGLGIVNRLESVTYLTSAALGMAVATLVGQNLGAGQKERAKESAHRGAAITTTFAGALTVLFLIRPDWVVGLFTTDAETIREGARFLRIVALSQIFMGWELVYGHAFIGAGNTVPPMVISVVTSVLRVPVVAWLAFGAGYGPTGIWWTISLTGILRGLLVVAWFRRADWAGRDLQISLPAVPPVHPAPVGPEGPEG